MEGVLKRLAGVFALGLFTSVSLAAQNAETLNSYMPDFYNESGVSSARESLGQGAETIDPFSGSLQLIFNEFSVPRNGALDTTILRTYSPNRAASGFGLSYRLRPTGAFGVGWDIHLGRIWNFGSLGSGTCPIAKVDTLQNPVLELPDGSRDVLLNALPGSEYDLISSKHWKAECYVSDKVVNGVREHQSAIKITDTNGVVYYFDYLDNPSDSAEQALLVTRMEDPHGNWVSVSYKPKSTHPLALIDRIEGSNGLDIGFKYRNATTSTPLIESISLGDRTWRYFFEDINGVVAGSFLTKVEGPEGLEMEYDYYPSSATYAYMLRSMTNAYGMKTEYSYKYAYFDGTLWVPYAAIEVKTVTGPDLQRERWTYDYEVTTDYNQTTVTGPDHIEIHRHFGTQTDGVLNYQVGLAQSKLTQSLSGKTLREEQYEWGLFKLSDQKNNRRRQGAWDVDQSGSPISGHPVQTKVTITQDGNDYTTSYSDFNTDGLPQKIVEEGQKSRTRQVRYEGRPNGVTGLVTKEWIEGLEGSTQNLSTLAGETTTVSFNPGSANSNQSDPMPAMSQSNGSTANNGSSTSSGMQAIEQSEQSTTTTVTAVSSVPRANLPQGSVSLSITRSYDAKGSLIRVNEYGIDKAVYTYHSDGELKTETDAVGRKTIYQDYKAGVARETAKVVNGQEELILRSVDNFGNITSITDERGYITNYDYDKLGRLKSITPTQANYSILDVADRESPSVYSDAYIPTTFSYSFSGRSQTMSQGSLSVTNKLDAKGRTIRATYTYSGGQRVLHYEYDSLDRASFQSYTNSALGVSYEYDALGRVTEVSLPGGRKVTNQYRNGNITEVKDAKLNITKKHFQAYGDPMESQLVRLEQPEGATTVIERNLLGLMTKVTQGNLTRFYDYDQFMRLARERHPETGNLLMIRNRAGEIIERRISGGSDWIEYQYDDYGAVKSAFVKSLDGLLKSTSYIRGPGGVLEQTRTSDGLVQDFVIDQKGNTIQKQIQFPGAESVSLLTYEINGYGGLESLAYPSGRRVSFAPNEIGQASHVSGLVSSVSYHPNGSVSSLLYENGVEKYVDQYEDDLNPRNLSIRGMSQTFVDLTYRYDLNGNTRRIEDTQNSALTLDLTYDGLNRLKAATGIWGQMEYGYDATGNIDWRKDNTITSDYKYDNKGRLIEVTGPNGFSFEYNPKGQVIGRNDTRFQYQGDELFSTSGNVSNEYLYDAQGQRVMRIGQDDATYYVYGDDGKLLYERSEGGYTKEYYYLAQQLVGEFETIPPTVNAPPHINVEADQPLLIDWDIQAGSATAFDYYGTALGVTHNYTGSVTLGTTYVDYRATDAWGDTGIARQAISVEPSAALLAQYDHLLTPEDDLTEYSGNILLLFRALDNWVDVPSHPDFFDSVDDLNAENHWTLVGSQANTLYTFSTNVNFDVYDASGNEEYNLYMVPNLGTITDTSGDDIYNYVHVNEIWGFDDAMFQHEVVISDFSGSDELILGSWEHGLAYTDVFWSRDGNDLVIGDLTVNGVDAKSYPGDVKGSTVVLRVRDYFYGNEIEKFSFSQEPHIHDYSDPHWHDHYSLNGEPVQVADFAPLELFSWQVNRLFQNIQLSTSRYDLGDEQRVFERLPQIRPDGLLHDNPIMEFGTGINPDDYTIHRIGVSDSFLLKHRNNIDWVALANWYGYEFTQFETVRFADGTELDLDSLTDAPEIDVQEIHVDPVEPVLVQVGQPVERQIIQGLRTNYSHDPDNFQISLLSAPDWMTWDAGSFTLSGTPSADDLGSYLGELEIVTRNFQAYRRIYVDILVVNPSETLSIRSTPETSVREDEGFNYTPTVEYSGSGELTFALVKGHWGMTINASTGEIEWAYPFFAEEPVKVLLMVTDGTHTAHQSFELKQATSHIEPELPGNENVFTTEPDQPLSINTDSFTSGQASFDDKNWEWVTFPGAIDGGAMQVHDDASVGFLTDYQSDAARIDYTIDFTQTGTYYIWIRGYGPNGTSDSVHVGLNGQTMATGEKIPFRPNGEWVWSNRLMDGGRALLEITETGVKTLNIWMRESGTLIDKVVLTKDSRFTPSGNGPDESQSTGGNGNNPPRFSSQPTVTATAGQLYEYAAVATDADSDTLQYTLVEKPSGMSITSTGVVRWTPSAGQEGTHPVSIKVSDGQSNSTQDYQLVVSSNGLVFQADANGQYVIEAENYSALIAAHDGYNWAIASDPQAVGGKVMEIDDGADVIYETDYLAEAARIDYAVNFAEAGQHYLWVRGFGKNGVSDTLHMGINNTQQLKAEKVYFKPELGWTWSKKQLGDWRPIYIDVPSPGVHAINVWVRESGNQFDRFILTKDASFEPSGNGPAESPRVGGNVNHEPHISNQPPLTVGFGQAYRHAVLASDIDGDSLSYRLTQAPNGMTITASGGIIDWTPIEGQLGSHTVTVAVSDGQEEVTQSWTLSVTSSGAAFQPDANGLVVMEAKNYSGLRGSHDGYNWMVIDNVGAVSGQALEIPDAADVLYETSYGAEAARVDYAVNFPAAGTYTIWLRGYGKDGVSDTVHVGLNGQANPDGEKLRFNTYATWLWTKFRMGGGHSTIDVPSAGVHTVNVWVRESGAIIDRIIVTQDSAYEPTGSGPAESFKE